MKKAVLVLIALGAGGAAALYTYRNLHADRGNRIVVSGNIELTQVDIAFKTAGRLVERAVDEGDPVKRDMVVARLDREQLQRQREREEGSLAVAQAALAQAETSWRWQRESISADVQAREADLSTAEQRLQELRNGPRPQERQEADAAVEAAAAQYEQAKSDWDRAQQLFKNDDISRAQYDQYRAHFQATDAALRQARERASLVHAGTRSEELEMGNSQVVRARAALRASQANQIELQRRQQEIDLRRADLARARAQIALIDSQLADTVAVSPIDGIVLVKAADVGEVLAPGATVLSVGDLDHPWLRAYIGERDLGRVKPGSPVKVTTDSFPGKVYNGRVSFISSEAEFTPKQIQTSEERIKLVYRIKVDIENPNHELKSNMPADAEILVGR
jgi:HlyD family secretion protein